MAARAFDSAEAMTMKTMARRLAPIMFAACLPLAAAYGQAIEDGNSSNVELGAGLVCDTREQAERFITVLDGDLKAAADAVNREVGDPTACILAGMAFVREGQISKMRGEKGTFNVLKIRVIGILTDSGMRAILPHVYYSVEKIDEIEA